MKIFTLLNRILIICLLCTNALTKLQAQCNVNDKYDKIISGYHSSIALKDNGVYTVWGSDMKSTGAADQLAPQDISSTNYSGLTGTIYKAAIGGKSAGAAVDQAILLTSDGLWAWGIVGNVLKSTIKSTAAFGKITAPTGATTLGLPTGVTPENVASIFASYQTLVLLTTSGSVYMLTQTTLAVEANGGTASTVGSSTWQKVKTNSSTYLANVTAVRGQVYNGTYNAFIALTSTGQVYTWGNSTYLGDGTVFTARNYATLMTIPSEFSSSIPKMIGVTGGGASGATTVANTYYLLSNAGNLYSLGNNSQKQCGDFTTTERTSWVQVKKSSTANDYLTNINFFSCQEHCASYPAVAAITGTGGLYTWGNNSSGMCGRTDDGTAGGTLTTVSFDPGVPVGFSATAISAEMGGHTMVYTKEGSTQFCYVGHYTNGSMGDGTAGNNGSASATTLKHDCSSTPSISICGYVPVAASAVYSVISASQTSIQANGSSTSTITIQLKDASNNNLTGSGGVITVNTTGGTIGTVTDNNNGTYTVVLTSPGTPGSSTISFSINGAAASNTLSVNFTSVLPLTWGKTIAYRKEGKLHIEWSTMDEVNLSRFEVQRSATGNNWTTAVDGILAANTPGTHQYSAVDPTSNADAVFYRIKQIDIDGKFSYSATVYVSAALNTAKLMVYPVPVTNNFYLGNINPNEIKIVEIYSNTSSLLKQWSGYQAYYNVESLPQGVYIVKVTTLKGEVQNCRITKR